MRLPLFSANGKKEALMVCMYVYMLLTSTLCEMNVGAQPFVMDAVWFVFSLFSGWVKERVKSRYSIFLVSRRSRMMYAACTGYMTYNRSSEMHWTFFTHTQKRNRYYGIVL